MDLRSLEVFLSVAETLNFTRTAEQLHLSVSAVSRTIQRHEESLGQPLFQRDRRHVRLTTAGREFRQYANETLASWRQMRARLGDQGALSGEVSLFCSVTASYSVLAPVLEAMRSRHPGIEMMLHTGDQADGISRVLAGLDDVAVSLRPLHLPSRLVFLPLVSTPLNFYLPTADCALRRTFHVQSPVDIDWATVPFIVPERGVTKDLLDEWMARRQLRPRIYAQVAGHEAITAMVALGLGVGVAPALVVEAGGVAERVETLMMDDDLPGLSIGLCAQQQRLQAPLIRSLWEVARQTYGTSA